MLIRTVRGQGYVVPAEADLNLAAAAALSEFSQTKIALASATN
jgi:hypothetical protein